MSSELQNSWPHAGTAARATPAPTISRPAASSSGRGLQRALVRFRRRSQPPLYTRKSPPVPVANLRLTKGIQVENVSPASFAFPRNRPTVRQRLPHPPSTMITRFLTEVNTKFNPFTPTAKTARNFLALLPPNARAGMKINAKMLPRTSKDPTTLGLKFSTYNHA